MAQNVRTRTLLNSEVQASDDATKILDLPRSGALHSMIIRARCTNGSTSGRGVNILDVLDLVEVVGNGSRTLFSLIPEVIEKRHEARRGLALPMVWNERVSAVQEMTFQINFGRWLYDPEMYLPLDVWSDLKLRLQFSPTISATVGFATGTVTFDVIGIQSVARPSVYRGTLVIRNVSNFTSAAAGDEIVEMHRGQMLRDINIYAYEAAIADDVDVSNVEIRADDGSHSFYNNGWAELLDMNALLYESNIDHHILALMNDDDVIDTRISVPTILSVGGEMANDVSADTFNLITLDNIAGDRLTANISVADVTAGSETHVTQTVLQPFTLGVGKHSPSYNVLLPFDWSDDPNDWLDTSRLTRLQAVISQAAAGADVRVSTAEVHNFIS